MIYLVSLSSALVFRGVISPCFSLIYILRLTRTLMKHDVIVHTAFCFGQNILSLTRYCMELILSSPFINQLVLRKNNIDLGNCIASVINCKFNLRKSSCGKSCSSPVHLTCQLCKSVTSRSFVACLLKLLMNRILVVAPLSHLAQITVLPSKRVEVPSIPSELSGIGGPH